MKPGDVCGNCGLECKEEHTTNEHGDYADPCIGKLPGVKYACCGHGERQGYILFENGVIVDIFDGEVVPDFYRTFNDEGIIRKKNFRRIPIGAKKG